MESRARTGASGSENSTRYVLSEPLLGDDTHSAPCHAAGESSAEAVGQPGAEGVELQRVHAQLGDSLVGRAEQRGAVHPSQSPNRSNLGRRGGGALGGHGAFL